MKTLLTSLTIFIFSTITFSQDSFCDGWDAGYAAGACYGNNFCVPPITPLCPLPRIGEDSFQGGYNRGFLAGLSSQHSFNSLIPPDKAHPYPRHKKRYV